MRKKWLWRRRQLLRLVSAGAAGACRLRCSRRCGPVSSPRDARARFFERDGNPGLAHRPLFRFSLSLSLPIFPVLFTSPPRVDPSLLGRNKTTNRRKGKKVREKKRASRQGEVDVLGFSF